MPLLWQQNSIQDKNGFYKSQGKMKCSAIIIAYENPKKIYNLFIPEQKKISGRGILKIKKKKKHIEFDIRADDSVALRAISNSITKLLTVYEKMKNLENG